MAPMFSTWEGDVFVIYLFNIDENNYKHSKYNILKINILNKTSIFHA